MNKNIAENESARLKRNKRIVLTVIASFLLAVIVSGCVIGAIAFSRDRRAVLKYGGVTVDEGVLSYLGVTYKTRFLSDMGISDAPDVWTQTVPGTNMTYGETLDAHFLDYVKGVVIGAYLFDRYSSISGRRREAIEKACSEVLDYKAGGDKDKFNEDTVSMGFDYRDMCRAAELLYKAETAKAIIYGVDGSALADASRLNECEEYYENYSCVKILYIPTLLDIERGDDGKLKTDSDGKYVTREFSPSEVSERLGEIDEIRSLIDAAVNGGDVKMTPTYFETLEKKYNYDTTYIKSGYYFSNRSAYRERFASDSSARLPEGYDKGFFDHCEWAASTALDMTVGEYRTFENEYGVSFLYKCEREGAAYAYPSLENMFHDFYSDAADYLYSLTANTLKAGVEVRDGYGKLDLATLPYNYVYVPKVEA